MITHLRNEISRSVTLAWLELLILSMIILDF